MRTELNTLAHFLGDGRQLTQLELANWVGVTQPTLSAWRTGRFKPREAGRSLVNLALRVADARPELLREVMGDPGDNGFQRLVAAVGTRRAVEMVGRADDTGTVRRLALLVELVKASAPELLEARAVEVPSFLRVDVPQVAPERVRKPGKKEPTEEQVQAARQRIEAIEARDALRVKQVTLSTGMIVNVPWDCQLDEEKRLAWLQSIGAPG